jgi:hypothetical protein
MAYDQEGARALPLRSTMGYETRRRSRASPMMPKTASAREDARVINSEETGGPPVPGSALPVAAGLAVAVPPVTVTLPTMPRSSCGMQK